jgi:predicted molibdopterin-dependent oxidoreductase YjgC
LFGEKADVLSKLDLLVVQESFMTKTAEMADVVLPVKAWSEKAGTYTSGEGRIQGLAKSVKAKGDLWADGAVVAMAARALGKEMSTCTGKVGNQIGSKVAGYGGHLSDEPLFASTPVAEAPLYKPAGNPGTEALAPTNEYPYLAVGGASLHLNGTVCARSEPSRSVCPEPYAAVNPADLAELGVDAGQKVKITTANGTADMVLKADSNIPAKVLLVNTNFAESNAGGLFERPYDAALAKLDVSN